MHVRISDLLSQNQQREHTTTLQFRDICIVRHMCITRYKSTQWTATLKSAPEAATNILRFLLTPTNVLMSQRLSLQWYLKDGRRRRRDRQWNRNQSQGRKYLMITGLIIFTVRNYFKQCGPLTVSYIGLKNLVFITEIVWQYCNSVSKFWLK